MKERNSVITTSVLMLIGFILLMFIVGFLSNSCTQQIPDRKPSRFDSADKYLVLLVNELPKPQDFMVWDMEGEERLLYEGKLGVNPTMYGKAYDPNSHLMDLPGEKDKGDTWMKDPWIGYGPQTQQPEAQLSDVKKMMLPIGEYLLLVKDTDKKAYTKLRGRVPKSHVINSEGPLVWHLTKEVFNVER